jgi:hypothetical protein
MRNENELAVFDWCKLVAHYLPSSDRIGCLRELIMNREHIQHDLRLVHHYKSSTNTFAILRIIEDILSRLPDQDDFYDDLEPRGRP